MVKIRLASVDDATALAELHVATVTVAYADIFPKDSPPPTPADLEPGYRSLLLDSTAATWLAEDGADGRIIGSIALVDDPAVPAGRRIERFNVRPGYQSAGVGTALYNEALAAARAHGVECLNLWVLEDNDRGRAIYEHWGWAHVPGHSYANDPAYIIDVLYERTL